MRCQRSASLAADDRSLNRRRQAGRRPIPRQEQVRNGGSGTRTVRGNPGTQGERCGFFPDGKRMVRCPDTGAKDLSQLPDGNPTALP